MVLLVLWGTLVELVVHVRHGDLSLLSHAALSLALLIFVVPFARLTSRVFTRPLEILEDAMASVGEGSLAPIQVSRTGDEIEQLGDSFNRMIEALAKAREQVREHREHLEEKIRERTAALEETMRRLEKASRAKGEFLANMSHELRTPMNGILGMLEIVLESDLTASQREELLTVKECSLTLLSLLNDILDLSKIEAGKMDLEAVPFDIRRLAEASCKPLLPAAREKDVELTWEVGVALPPQLTGDPLRMRQILGNLVGNAIKFTERGYVRLSIESCPGAPGKTGLLIRVVDSGIGIPQDKLESIFEEFAQADGSTTRKYGGTGLGLAITRKLVKLHGGSIRVESAVGRGTVFEVTMELPHGAPARQEGSQRPGRFLDGLPNLSHILAPGSDVADGDSQDEASVQNSVR